METIIRAGDFPVGMEAFPAADEEQFDFIKSVIDECGYDVLIIAGRYGSPAPDGLSCTEKEYHYAVEKGVPVLVPLRGDRERLGAGLIELEPEMRAKRDAFIATTTGSRLRKEWTTTDGLKPALHEALAHAKKTKARPGWVRGDHAVGAEMLERMVRLQEENEALRAKVAPVAEGLPEPAGLDTVMERRVTYTAMDNWGSRQHEKLSVSIEYFFTQISPHFRKAQQDFLEMAIKSMEKASGIFCVDDSLQISDADYQTIKIQLEALGLIQPAQSRNSANLLWSLTEKGEQEMFRRKVIAKT